MWLTIQVTCPGRQPYSHVSHLTTNGHSSQTHVVPLTVNPDEASVAKEGLKRMRKGLKDVWQKIFRPQGAFWCQAPYDFQATNIKASDPFLHQRLMGVWPHRHPDGNRWKGAHPQQCFGSTLPNIWSTRDSRVVNSKEDMCAHFWRAGPAAASAKGEERLELEGRGADRR